MPVQRRDTSDLTGLRCGVYLRVSRADRDDKRQLRAGVRDEERSTDTQRRVYVEWADHAGVITTDEYADPDMSASRFAIKKNRPEFERMVADVKAGKLDVLWFWEISRQQRRLDVFASLRDLCRDHGVLWVMRDRVADPADSKDMLLAGIQSMIAEDESEKLSVRVTDGKESRAFRGARSGRFPYGYRRGKWDPAAETFGPDEPDVHDASGRPEQDSPAAVVREIFDRLRDGDSITGIRHDLNDRGIRTPGDVNSPGGYEFSNSRVRYIAMNPVYAGLPVRHIGKGSGLSRRSRNIIDGVDAKWPPLVDTDTFWTVYRRLADPARTTTKPHRPGGRLLSSVAKCGVCGGPLLARNGHTGYQAAAYQCQKRNCTGISLAALDEFAEAVMVRWLSRPETAEQLVADGESAAVRQARQELDRAEAELAEWIADAAAGRVNPAMARAATSALDARIADARDRIEAGRAPWIPTDATGPAAAAGWKALSVSQRRQHIAQVADIRVRRVGRLGPRAVPARDRVEWRWLIGDGEDLVPAVDLEAELRAGRQSELASRREHVAHLRDLGMSRDEIAAEIGMSVHTVKKDIEAWQRSHRDA